MRVIARNTLIDFSAKHPETKVALEQWYKLVRAAHWASKRGLYFVKSFAREGGCQLSEVGVPMLR